MAEEARIGNDEPRKPRAVPKSLMSLTSGPEQDENDPISIDRLPICRFPTWRPALAPGLRRACRGGSAAYRRCRQPAQGRGAYDGTWNVVFATTRGNCSSGYSVPFTVTGSRVSSAGGGRVSGSVNRGGASRSASRSAPPRRAAAAGSPAQRRRLVERHHYRRPLQRHLAGDAKLTTGSSAGYRETKSARQIGLTGRLQRQILGAISNQRGASTITTWRPSNRASCSTLANSATSALTLSSSLVPISWCAISRPR